MFMSYFQQVSLIAIAEQATLQFVKSIIVGFVVDLAVITVDSIEITISLVGSIVIATATILNSTPIRESMFITVPNKETD